MEILMFCLNELESLEDFKDNGCVSVKTGRAIKMAAGAILE